MPRVASALPAYTEEDIDEAYRLAYWLHPDATGVVAVQIVRGAASTVVAMAQNLDTIQRKRRKLPSVERSPHRRVFPEPEGVFKQVAFQLAILELSDERVRREPQGGLTPDDWLVHYVKWLCWKSLLHTWQYTTLALGRYLYAFDPPELDAVAPRNLINARLHGDFRTRCASIAKDLRQRFHLQGDLDTLIDKRQLTAREETLAKETLTRCTPWYLAMHRVRPHLQDVVPLDTALQPGEPGWAALVKLTPTLGQQALTPEMVDWLATCLQLSPELGMAQLIRATPGHSQQGHDPMYVPSCPDPFSNTRHTSASGEHPSPQDRNPEGPAPPGDCTGPPPLDERHLELLKDHLEEEQQRRIQYTGTLRCVRTAGEEYRFQGAETAGDFRVPGHVPWLRIYGEDAQGELLLAVMPFVPADKPQILRVDAGSRRIMCMIGPIEGNEDEPTVSVRLTCTPVPWWVRLGRTIWLMPPRVAQLLGHLSTWVRGGGMLAWRRVSQLPPRPLPVTHYWLLALPRRAALAVGTLAVGLCLSLALNGWLGWQLSEHTRGVANKSARIRLAFADDARAQDVRTLLLTFGATIIGGPSPQGIYVAQVPLPSEPRRGTSEDPLHTLLEKFRKYPAIVRLAEPIAPN